MPFDLDCTRCNTSLELPLRDGAKRICPTCELNLEVSVENHEPFVLYDPDDARRPQDVECEVHEKLASVPWRDGTYTCPHCKNDIVIDDGVAEHEVVHEVQCPVHGHDVTLVAESDLENGETVRCAWCLAEISAGDDEPVHAAAADVVHRGDGSGVYVLVHGFNNAANKDYRAWRKQLTRLGWTGQVLGFQWHAPALLLADGWPAAVTRAEEEGPRLAELLRGLALNHRDVRVLGFSLGTRVIHFALIDLARDRPRRRIRVRLCGGAFPSEVSWTTAARVAHGPIDNYWSASDLMLVGFVAAQRSRPIGHIGLKKIRPASRVQNFVAEIGGEGIGHHDYEHQFAEFGRL